MPVEHLELGAIVDAAVAEDAIADLGVDGGLRALDAGLRAGFDPRLEDGATRIVRLRRTRRREHQRRDARQKAQAQTGVPPCLATSAMRDW